MTPSCYFVDTSYILAIVNVRDQWHAAAKKLERQLVDGAATVVTTQFVLIEVANTLSRSRSRSMGVSVVDAVHADRRFRVIPASDDLYRRGLHEFRKHVDKNWGMTDCTSFAVMSQLNLQLALSSDHHFVQAGFRALLLEEVER